MDCGLNTFASFVKFNPDGSLPKIVQCSLFGDSIAYSADFPQAGMMRRGKCYPLPPWVAVMSASGFGLLADGVTIEEAFVWATPTVNGNNNFKGSSKKAGDGLATQAKAASARARPSPQAHDHMATSGAVHGWEKTGAGKQTNLNDAVVRDAQGVGSPRATPQARDFRSSNGKHRGFGQVNLNDQVVRRSESSRTTPTCADARISGKGKGHNPLNQQVKASVSARPTPTAHAAKNPSPNEKNRDGLNFAVSRGVGKGNRSVFGLARPTPCATDAKGSGGKGEDRDRLDYAVERGRTKSHEYPTPRCRDLCGGTGAHNKLKNLAAVGIQDAEEARALGAKMYPTITQSDVHIYPGGTSGQASVCVDAQVRREALEQDPKSQGQLNPDWVEWLMNWPFGWTDPDADALVWFAPEHDPADLDDDHPLYIPRITTRKEFRIKRIVTLGNGQVPLCALAAEIWGLEILAAISNF